MLLEFTTMNEKEMYCMVHNVYSSASYEIAKGKHPETQDLAEAIREEEQYFVEKFLGKFMSKNENTYYVWEENGEWVSALRLSKLDGYYFMEALETKTEARGKGYATKLILETIALLRTRGDVILRSNVNKKNVASLSTHMKCGFEIEHENGINYISGTVRENVYGMIYRE